MRMTHLPPALFCSRDTRYRAPFGAIQEGESVFFRVCVPREWGCCGAQLTIYSADCPHACDQMFWAGMEGDHHEWWDCTFTPEKAGIYFYTFRLQTNRGARWLVPLENGEAPESDHENGRFQLTCYERAFSTPDWMAGGVMYQIFPDRFARSATAKKDVPSDRILRDDWGAQPEWRPDANGRVWNNDYFQGDLKGIEQHLDHLESLGVSVLYLNPIFEAHSNHRYNTADYAKIDPLLGDEKALKQLCKAAKKRGIRVILDGVFSHTGADSRYFNREHRYDTCGAFESMGSPYYSWYHFGRWPDKYASWWGFLTLPEVQECDPSFSEYITGENGILRRWMRAGISGWRLDVADELPDAFLDRIREAVKAEQSDALVLGEVWEDASNKCSYGHLRRYLLGKQLDSVMNYPFRKAILSFVRNGNRDEFFNTVMPILEHYPPQVIRLLMNSIGTHDTERAITALAGAPANGRDRKWQAQQTLSDDEREHGIPLMKCATALQFCLPGVPCIYYGDEAGLEGYADPFNRECYPWGHENSELVEWHKALGKLRHQVSALREGAFYPLDSPDDTVAFLRTDENSGLICAVNRSGEERRICLPPDFDGATIAVGDGWVYEQTLYLPPYSAAILHTSQTD